jgi:hypothetical protein
VTEIIGFSFVVKTVMFLRQNKFVFCKKLPFLYRRVTCLFILNIDITITVKHNDPLIISLINITCVGLEDHHRALKYFILKRK